MNRLIIILLISLNSIVLSGQIINIPADYATIQLGINAANNGDTVLVDTGIYIENINFSGKNIKLVSHFIFTMDTNFIHQTIIDGDSSGSVISIVNGEDSTAQIMGFTIQNGYDTLGGGIKIINSDFTIMNCEITNNIAYTSGGGIYCENSNPIITYSTISQNYVQGGNEINGVRSGGGVRLFDSGGSITYSSILSNSILSGWCKYGGGISYRESTTEINNVIIDGNSIYKTSPGGIIEGGGLEIRLYDPTSQDTIFFKNLIISNNTSSGGDGGGISTEIASYYPYHKEIFIINSLINNNHAYHGGGAFCYGKNTRFINCTFADNTGGNGIFLIVDTRVYLINSILSNNTPSELEIFYYPGQGISKAFLSFCNTYPNGFAGYTEGVILIEGNFNSSPNFIQTGDHPFNLSNESPCINAGTPDTTGLMIPEHDLGNNDRIYGGRIDVGAYENQEIWVYSTELSDSHFSIEPNPFINRTILRYKSSTETNIDIDLYDLTGRKILNFYKDLNISKGNAYPINTYGLSKGSYLLVIKSAESTISKIIIKQ